MKRYKIEKNTVQETLVIPLYGRWLCSQRYPHLFQDENVAELMERIDYDFFELEKRSAGLMQEFGAMETAMRQKDMAWEVRDYLLSHPNAAVVNLGCGLDCTGRNLWSTWAVDWTALDGTVTMEAVKYITLICRMSSG